ncbi:Uncharacterised protein [Mycobacterium tuberculosis]|nr:Uncharacterised protein [Mycobacterium tuberculosis]
MILHLRNKNWGNSIKLLQSLRNGLISNKNNLMKHYGLKRKFSARYSNVSKNCEMPLKT